MKRFRDFRKAEDLQEYINKFATAVAQVNFVLTTAQSLLQKWEGKMLNKRFATQLQDLFPEEVETEDGYKYKKISIYYGQDWDNKIISFTIFRIDYDIAQEIHTGFTFYKPSRYNDGLITTDYRIKADDACKYVQRLINSNLERLHHYADAHKYFREYATRYQQAKDDFKKAISDINPYFLDDEIRTHSLDKTDWEKRMQEELQHIIANQ